MGTPELDGYGACVVVNCSMVARGEVSIVGDALERRRAADKARLITHTG